MPWNIKIKTLAHKFFFFNATKKSVKKFKIDSA